MPYPVDDWYYGYAIVRNIQDFADKSYKCLAKTLQSCDLFQELTFRETLVSSANFRITDFSLCTYFQLLVRCEGLTTPYTNPSKFYSVPNVMN